MAEMPAVQAQQIRCLVPHRWHILKVLRLLPETHCYRQRQSPHDLVLFQIFLSIPLSWGLGFSLGECKDLKTDVSVSNGVEMVFGYVS